MKKQFKSSIIKNHKITTKTFFDSFPLKGSVASLVILRFRTRNKIKMALDRSPEFLRRPLPVFSSTG